ncbi:MAG TPA: GNAT family N-acetyltransferase, partial [Candidatus Limnocylindria bacterium]|nr:GNAT family N-acetyltransferase [Candidatus Limnocylindria bacterium]
TPSDRPRVVATVVAAFVADPAFRFFFPDDRTYPADAAAFAGFLFDKRVDRGALWVANGGAAVSLWDRPAGPAAPELTLDVPEDARDRLAAYDSAVHPALPRTPHWYLGVLATDPAHAGQGWGRAVMGAGLEEAEREELPAFLETTNDGNVAVYERAGWSVSSTAVVGPLHVRIMRHPAGSVTDPTG